MTTTIKLEYLAPNMEKKKDMENRRQAIRHEVEPVGPTLLKKSFGAG